MTSPAQVLHSENSNCSDVDLQAVLRKPFLNCLFCIHGLFLVLLQGADLLGEQEHVAVGHTGQRRHHQSQRDAAPHLSGLQGSFSGAQGVFGGVRTRNVPRGTGYVVCGTRFVWWGTRYV